MMPCISIGSPAQNQGARAQAGKKKGSLGPSGGAAFTPGSTAAPPEKDPPPPAPHKRAPRPPRPPHPIQRLDPPSPKLSLCVARANCRTRAVFGPWAVGARASRHAAAKEKKTPPSFAPGQRRCLASGPHDLSPCPLPFQHDDDDLPARKKPSDSGWNRPPASSVLNSPQGALAVAATPIVALTPRTSAAGRSHTAASEDGSASTVVGPPRA
jgi:hypothetical protein